VHDARGQPSLGIDEARDGIANGIRDASHTLRTSKTRSKAAEHTEANPKPQKRTNERE
jgi:hypothetical protein